MPKLTEMPVPDSLAQKINVVVRYGILGRSVFNGRTSSFIRQRVMVSGSMKQLYTSNFTSSDSRT
jgi:hypothetical protein